MSKQYTDFHHYKGSTLDRFEKIERQVIELLITTDVPDEKRDDGIVFELMHAAGCMDIGRVLAQKRDLSVGLTSVCCILHDIAVVVTGKYKDHAKEGAPIAEKMLRAVGEYSEEEIKIITNAVQHHSEKEIYTDDPYTELVKDADVFQCSLYKNSEGYYRLHKPEHIVAEYIKRIQKVRRELSLNPEDIFR